MMEFSKEKPRPAGGRGSGLSKESITTFHKEAELSSLLIPIPENIPYQLKQYPQWVVWIAVPKKDRTNKIDKVPYDPKNGKKAKSNDHTTWGDFQTAWRAYESGGYAGIGFVLSEHDPFCGWDLDDCIGFLQNDSMATWAEEIVNTLESYTEISPSGTGVRIVVIGTLPPEGRKKGNIEVYQDRRFLTITGHLLNHSFTTPEDRGTKAKALHAKIFSNGYNARKNREVSSLSDENARILEKAFASKNGNKIQALYNGEWAGHKSQSEADQALCSSLAFWLDKDAHRIDAVFRQSGLYRKKWDEKHKSDGRTYGQLTIGKAIEGAGDTYQGSKKKADGGKPGSEDTGKEKKKKPSMADLLVGMVPEGSLFHLDDTPYVDLEIQGHRETWPVRSKVFRNWLAYSAFTRVEKAPSSQAMQDALSTICGKALFQGPEREVFVRLGERNNCIYLDLGRPDWSVVEITSEGWRILQNPEIRFWRPKGLRPLPRPESDGSIKPLADLLNITSERDFRLIVGWLLSALRKNGPFPILTFSGEQGTGKSTAGRILRRLIDPNVADLRTTARTEQDLVIAAKNGRVIALDNLSGVKTWLSDALCRIATGGGFGTRELYSDMDEVLIEVQRPIIINGIEDLCTRGDLADRAIICELPVIKKDQRMTEKDLDHCFASARPKILGGLLDAVVSGLRYADEVELEELPRMADAAIWWCACERGGVLPWKEGGLLEAFQGSRDSIIESFLENDEVAAAIVNLLNDSGDFAGTTTELLAALNQMRENTKNSKSWPATVPALSGRIRRAEPFLREYGVVIKRKREDRSRIIHIKKIP